MVDESVLWASADRGARLVALSLLADAQTAGDTLRSVALELRDGDAAGDDALHDFRVAVRRLRSWIRAFQPQLYDSVSRTERRRLSKVAAATGAIRDATVHLAWLRGERRAMSARQRVGNTWIRMHMQQKRQAGCDPALSAATEFQDMIAKLTRRLSVYPCQVIVHKRPPRFGPIFAERMLTESESLRRDLTAIHEFTDVEAAHRARIAAKRLRYVVELLSKLGDDADAIIDTLKSLQDALGDLHDVHVFLPEVEAAEVKEAVRPGLLRIARRLHERGALAYARIERDWLNDAGALFFDRVREQAAGIARRPPDRNEMQNT